MPFNPSRVFRRSCLLVAILLFTQFTILAQRNLIRNYTVVDGLPSNLIYNIIQDKEGYIWIATDNGLSRFDGQIFTSYNTSNGLPDNDILGIFTDENNHIWLNCFNKNLCYIYKNVIYTRENDSNLASLHFNSYTSFVTNLPHKNIILDRSVGQFYEIKANTQIKRLQGNHTYLGLNDFYIKLCYDQLELYTNEDKLIQRLQLPKTKNPFSQITRTGKNECILFNKSDCLIVQIKNQQFQFKSIPKPTWADNPIFYTGAQTWVRTSLDELTPLDTNLALIPEQQIRLAQNPITNFFIDKHGGRWIGTNGNGIYYIPNSDIHIYNTNSGLADNSVYSICSQNHEIYFTTADASLQRIKANQVDKFRINLKNQCLGKLNALHSQGNYVISGSETGSLFIYDLQLAKMFVQMPGGSLKDIEPYGKNKFLASTSSNLYQFDLSNFSKKEIVSGRYTSCLALNDSTIWGGRVNQLVTVNINHDTTQKNKIRHFDFNDLTISDIKKINNLIIVGTVQKGIILIEGSQFQTITTTNGLLDNHCKNIYIDSTNAIWIITTTGINQLRINSINNAVHVLTLKSYNGLLANSINDICREGDYMYVASTKGIIRFPANYLNQSSNPPSIYINNISIQGRQLSDINSSLHIHPDSNSISFSFAALDYQSLGDVRYRYRLLGLDPQWKVSDSKTLLLERLKPGHYKLEVHAINSKNIQSTIPATLYFTISPYWWQQKFILWLAALLFGSLIYFTTQLLIKKRFQKRLAEETLKQHITEVELKAIKAQINPHFIFNTLNAIQYFIQENDAERADNYLNKMSSLIRKTLDFSNLQSIPIFEEIQYLSTYLELESLRFDERFSFDIQNDLPENMMLFQIPTMVLQPHIENAIRHGLKPKRKGPLNVTLRFYADAQHLIVDIDDNGIGREESKKRTASNQLKHTSQGESLSDSKLNIFKQSTGKNSSLQIIDKFEEGVSTGTLVKLSIQL